MIPKLIRDFITQMIKEQHLSTSMKKVSYQLTNLQSITKLLRLQLQLKLSGTIMVSTNVTDIFAQIISPWSTARIFADRISQNNHNQAIPLANFWSPLMIPWGGHPSSSLLILLNRLKRRWSYWTWIKMERSTKVS